MIPLEFIQKRGEPVHDEPRAENNIYDAVRYLLAMSGSSGDEISVENERTKTVITIELKEPEIIDELSVYLSQGLPGSPKPAQHYGKCAGCGHWFTSKEYCERHSHREEEYCPGCCPACNDEKRIVELEAENAKLRKALEFYALKMSWFGPNNFIYLDETSFIWIDDGKRARKALKDGEK
jgi:hypothetical protein